MYIHTHLCISVQSPNSRQVASKGQWETGEGSAAAFSKIRLLWGERDFFTFPICRSIQKRTKEECSSKMSTFFYRGRWVLLCSSFSDGGPSVKTFGDPRSFEGEREISWSDQQGFPVAFRCWLWKAKWVKFCFAWLSFTIPVIVLRSEEIPTASPGKVGISLLWKRLLLQWSPQHSSLFLALCIQVCLNFPCNNSFVIKWLE